MSEERKIFGIGMSRTGTTSLTRALNILKINTIHYPHDSQTYEELTSGVYRLSILEKYQAITDITVTPFYAQLDAAYPGSKFILTLRDKDSWLGSLRAHWQKVFKPGEYSDEFVRFTDFISACVYGTLGFNEERMAYAYDVHKKNVLDYFQNREQDLLVINICDGDGWPELCQFLDLPVPQQMFPHKNQSGVERRDTIEFRQIKQKLESSIPLESSMILVGHQLYGEDNTRCLNARPFLEKNHLYWGDPKDGHHAVSELLRMHKQGAQYIVFVPATFWFLDVYVELASYLREKCSVVIHDDQILAFSL